MSTHKNFDRICVAAVILSLLLTVLLMAGCIPGNGETASLGYEDRLFASDRVHTIDIVIEDWESFLQTCQSETYSLCSVVIDGEAVSNVGIRGKGNTSLSTVSSMDSDRYSFKIEFDQYDNSLSYHGLDKLCLNNIIQDNTYMKDYLTYQLMGQFGVSAPLCSYAYLTVNGEDWGLYLAVEGIEDAFLQRNYGADSGDLYKPDSMNMGGGRGNGKDFSMSQFEMPVEDTEQHAEMGKADRGGMQMGNGSSDVKLQYIDENPDSYSSIFSSAKTDVTEDDQTRLIDSLRQLSSYENLPEVVDIEQVLRYFVVHNFVVNGDSYTGSMIHNYYLYEEEGRLSMIPWDYNLAFGTFQGGSAASSVNAQIDEVLEDRPMQAWIFSDEAYSQQYYDLYARFLETCDLQNWIETTYRMIAPYVAADPTAFCTYQQFETGVEALKTFCALRAESVERQLNGEEEAVDVGDLTISDMGTMNMGGRGNQMPQLGAMPDRETGMAKEGIQLPEPNMEDMEMPENMQMPNMGAAEETQKGRTQPSGRRNLTAEGMQMQKNPTEQADAQGDSAGMQLLAVLAVLLIGVLIAWRYRK